jgi:hypothetical protein
MAVAKRESARRGLYSRFFRGPVLGPETASEEEVQTIDETITNTSSSSSTLPEDKEAKRAARKEKKRRRSETVLAINKDVKKKRRKNQEQKEAALSANTHSIDERPSNSPQHHCQMEKVSPNPEVLVARSKDERRKERQERRIKKADRRARKVLEAVSLLVSDVAETERASYISSSATCSEPNVAKSRNGETVWSDAGPG